MRLATQTSLPAPKLTRPYGRVHDLAAILSDVHAQYFCGASRPRITWKPWSRLGLRTTVARYFRDTDLIQLHPVLDSPCYPPWFVGWIVFHELVHRQTGSHLHDKAFRGLERVFAACVEAREFERQLEGRA